MSTSNMALRQEVARLKWVNAQLVVGLQQAQALLEDVKDDLRILRLPLPQRWKARWMKSRQRKRDRHREREAQALAAQQAAVKAETDIMQKVHERRIILPEDT